MGRPGVQARREQDGADLSRSELTIYAPTKVFKVFAGEFEGEPFSKGSPSINNISILIIL